MLRCSSCGRENTDSAESCVACGTNLTARDFGTGVTPRLAESPPQPETTVPTSRLGSGESPPPPPRAQPQYEALDAVRREYPALQTISGVFRFLGWLTIVLGVLGAFLLAVAAGSGEDGNPAVALLVLVGGVLCSATAGVILLALADLILLFIDIERNTRATALKPR